jgi:kynurenine formamidase
MRQDYPDPAEDGSGLWGRSPVSRPWRDTLVIERFLEPPPFSGLEEFITIWAHTGTHVDSEYNDNPKGQILYDMPLDAFCGEALALDMTFVGQGKTIGEEHLKRFSEKIKPGDTVFLFSEYDSWETAPTIPFEAGMWLLDKGIKGYGAGGNSIRKALKCHKLFHEKRLTVYDRLDIEGLKQISGKRVFFMGFPLRINYLSTSPCRLIALEE